jgi:hypothetical protein
MIWDPVIPLEVSYVTLGGNTDKDLLLLCRVSGNTTGSIRSQRLNSDCVQCEWIRLEYQTKLYMDPTKGLFWYVRKQQSLPWVLSRTRTNMYYSVKYRTIPQVLVLETKWYSEKIHSRRLRRYRVPHPLTRILPSCLAPLQYVPRQQSVDDCEDRIVCVDGPQSDDIILYRVTENTSGSIK